MREVGRTLVALALATALGVFGACGGGGGSTGPTISVSGTYRINGFSNFVGSFTATATLQQNGSQVTGDYRNSAGATFRINGSVSGTHVTAQLIGTNNPGVCSAEGDFFPDGRTGQGSFNCQAGGRTVDSGTFTINRTS